MADYDQLSCLTLGVSFTTQLRGIKCVKTAYKTIHLLQTYKTALYYKKHFFIIY